MPSAIAALIFCLIVGAQSFMFDDECTVGPAMGPIPKDPDATFTAVIPQGCENGSFIWNYPRGHVMLTLQNSQKISTSICVKDWVVGSWLTVADVTNPSVNPVPLQVTDTDACTALSTASQIVLKIDAPEMQQLYISGLEYTIRH